MVRRDRWIVVRVVRIDELDSNEKRVFATT
jgi:hypothetical protein